MTAGSFRITSETASLRTLCKTHRFVVTKGNNTMNIKKIAAVGISAAAVAAFSVSSFAFDFGNKDLGKGWSANITITGDVFAEEFGDATENGVFTLKYEADASLADTLKDNYWCVKTMLNDTGWPFVDTFKGVELSENKDTYVTPVDATEIKFSIPADDLEAFKTAGMAFMGHGITLISLTYSEDQAPAPAAATAAPTAGDTKAATENPKTGTGLAVSAMVASLGAAIVSRKRK